MTSLLLLTTGGTIAGNTATGTPLSDPSRRIQLSTIIKAAFQGSTDRILDVPIDEVELWEVDSSDIGPEHWSLIARTIREHYDSYDGFIVTHGTNTMGFTCAALSFVFPNIAKPVVVTGSQIPYGEPGSDALTNLVNAMRVATHPHSGGLRGVVCVFGSYIISGTRAKKTTEFDLDAFQSKARAGLGRIGRQIQLDSDNVAWHHSYLDPLAPATFGSELKIVDQFDPRVLSLTEFPGMQPAVLGSLIDSLCRGEAPLVRGIVLRAFGAGDVSTDLHPALHILRALKIPIVVTTQAPNGVSNFRVNIPGRTLAKEHLAIPAHDMSIEAMTTKLMWLLGQEMTYDEVCAAMLEDLHGEITILPEGD